MHQYTWTYTLPPDQAAATWTLDNVPAGAQGQYITHVQDDTGALHTPDHQEIDPTTGHLLLHFGVVSISGTAYGSYFLDHADDDSDSDNDDDDSQSDDTATDDDQVTVTGDGSHTHATNSTHIDQPIVDRNGNTVNITVNQYDHGSLESQSSS